MKGLGKIKIWGSISDGCFEFALTTCSFCMKLAGIWPRGGKLSHLLFFQFLASHVFITTSTAFSILSAPNRIELLRRVMNCAISLSATMKLLVYKCNVKSLTILLDDVAFHWQQYPLMKTKNKLVVTRYMNIGRCIYFATIITVEIPTIYFSYNYIINFYDVESIREDVLNNTIYPRDLKNHSYYLVVLYLAEIYYTQITAIFLITMDSFFAIILLHAIGQVQLLNNTLLEYKGQMHTEQYPNDDMCKCIKCIVTIHTETIRFVNHVEDTFNILLLIDFTRFLFSYCIVIYCMAMFYSAENINGITEFIMYIVIINFTTFVPCFFSHYVTEMVASTGLLAYSCNWTDYDKEKCDCILFIILRSQKSVNITAGKCFEVNRVTYKNIVSMSISYASVLFALK